MASVWESPYFGAFRDVVRGRWSTKNRRNSVDLDMDKNWIWTFVAGAASVADQAINGDFTLDTFNSSAFGIETESTSTGPPAITRQIESRTT